jgi:glycosyltransferase involved in cell wall biosynthesis
MNLIVTSPIRYTQDQDGSVRTLSPADNKFWQRYLAVFDTVTVVGRCRHVKDHPVGAHRVDGEGVKIVSVPYYHGPRQYLFKMPAVRKALADIWDPSSAIIVRGPGPISARMAGLARAVGQPYGIEVIGDPYDVFAPGAVNHPLRPFFRWWWSRSLKRLCADAAAVAYVTSYALQQRYPARPDAFTTHYSSIQLDDETFVDQPRTYDSGLESCKIVTVGSLEQLYKGTDVLIESVASLSADGVDVTLTVVGDGAYRGHLEQLARRLDVDRRVEFLGKLPAGKAVRDQLDRADLFILPSRTEGLPRAMIEAMARGLPCIGSEVGGIPELLASNHMVSAHDARALADKIRELIQNRERMIKASARNLEIAKAYRSEVLQARRNEFYSYLRQRTEEWVM